MALAAGIMSRFVIIRCLLNDSALRFKQYRWIDDDLAIRT